MSSSRFDGDVLIAVLLIVLALASVFLAVRAVRAKRYGRALVAGALAGMCGYTAVFMLTFQIRLF
jgi:hypothetical protein